MKSSPNFGELGLSEQVPVAWVAVLSAIIAALCGVIVAIINQSPANPDKSREAQRVEIVVKATPDAVPPQYEDPVALIKAQHQYELDHPQSYMPPGMSAMPGGPDYQKQPTPQ